MPVSAVIFRRALKSPHVIFSLEYFIFPILVSIRDAKGRADCTQNDRMQSLPIPQSMTPCPGWELPDPQVLGPLRHIVALAADIRRPTMMVAADLLHKERDVQIRAFVP